MTQLRHGEWLLSYPGTDFVFGNPETPVWHRKTPDIGDVDLRVADVNRPRQDGKAFGVDYRSGRTITFEMGVRGTSPTEVRTTAAELTKAWRADPVRKTPGAVAELRLNYDGRERLVYGRPRRFAPDYSDVAVNQFINVVADFACADDLFYDTEEEGITFSIVPSLGGGLMAPLASPLTTTADSDRSQGITVVSEMDVWPVIRIDGPITNPIVNIGDVARFEVRLSLEHDEWVEIDTRPWARHALRNGTANVSGTVRGTRLAQAAIPAGSYEVGFKGNDPTGTASVRITWRPTYSSP